MRENNILEKYRGKKILVTGGLGFVGSNITHKLVSLGAQVTILDNLAPLYGGNKFNIHNIKDKVTVVVGDIRDTNMIDKLVVNMDMIFDFAAQISYIDSGNIPFEDLEINCKGHLNILEASRKFNPSVKILFSSSRLALGKIIENPVTENHPTNPLSIYGIHKLTAEKYFLLYHKNLGMKTTVFRITNPYGPRQQIKHSKYSIPGWFMRQAMENKTIKIFGDGKQLRDYIYVSDLVQAFLLAGISDNTNGQICNCGSGKSIEFQKMVKLVIGIAKSGTIEHVPWPSDYEKEETGDFETDISKLQAAINWVPEISMEEGLHQMYEYYKANFDKYIPL